MIHPFQPMPIYGAIWYQGMESLLVNMFQTFKKYDMHISVHIHMCVGESNTYNYVQYGCAIQQMVADWRYSWVTNSPTMNPRFPFGEVQVITEEQSFS